MYQRKRDVLHMNQSLGTLFIVLSCMGILLVGAVRKKLEWLLNLVMRGVLGMVSIYFVNMGLAGFGISLGVGMNAVTLLTSAVLGFPGILALYGVGIYRML